MSLFDQVFEMITQAGGKDMPQAHRTQTSRHPKRAGRSLQRVWVVEISEAGHKTPEWDFGEQLATIYEFGKPFEARGALWELIDQQLYGVRDETEQFWRGLVMKISDLGMRQGDLILVIADEQDRLESAVREIS
jgi:hypothetical protein